MPDIEERFAGNGDDRSLIECQFSARASARCVVRRSGLLLSFAGAICCSSPEQFSIDRSASAKRPEIDVPQSQLHRQT
jgi:hypothetical protein